MAPLTLLIRCANATKYTVTVDSEGTVLDLKKAIEETSQIPAGEQRLIVAGKIMKDEQALSTYGKGGKREAGIAQLLVRGRFRCMKSRSLTLFECVMRAGVKPELPIHLVRSLTSSGSAPAPTSAAPSSTPTTAAPAPSSQPFGTGAPAPNLFGNPFASPFGGECGSLSMCRDYIHWGASVGGLVALSRC